jgi:hypothetical protein
MMDKVWLVYVERGAYSDYSQTVYEVCGSFDAAVLSKKRVEDNIQNEKDKYELLHNSSYDEDVDFVSKCASINMDSERFQTTSDRLWDFELYSKYLSINGITIEEREIRV